VSGESARCEAGGPCGARNSRGFLLDYSYPTAQALQRSHANLSANGYYKPGAYFLSKVLFDILPLRVIPPFVLGSIVYGLAGLNPEVSCFWKFIMTLVLFNLAASSIVLFISVSVADQGVANLLGSLVMLYK
jgi:hypothetical protein